LVFISYHVQSHKEQQLLYGRPNTKFDGFQIKVFDRHLAAKGLFLRQHHFFSDGSCCESRVFLKPLRGVVVSIQADEDDLTKRTLKFTTTWRRLCFSSLCENTFLQPQNISDARFLGMPSRLPDGSQAPMPEVLLGRLGQKVEN